MNEDKFILIAKNLANEASAKEKAELGKWINASDDNKSEFDKYLNVWNKSKRSYPQNIPEFESFWQVISSQLDKELSADARIHPLYKTKFHLKHYIPIAASIIILLGSLFIFQNNLSSLEIVKTGIKERHKVILPDGSFVTLNNDSEIRYPENFDQQERKIILKGQAYFEVLKNTMPFIVYTQNARVKVLGTHFDVNNRGLQTKVIVKSGQVLLSLNEQDEGVILHKNEMSVILKDDKPHEISKVNAEYLLGWLNDILVFDKTPLIEITQELERYYGIKIEIEDNIRNLELTGEFTNQPAEEVIDLVCLALNLNYNYENDVIRISR